ncbi:MAG: alkaline phosphatase D family protein [bacterium]
MTHIGRRAFLRGMAITSVAGCASLDLRRPKLTFGPACFDVTSTSALIWLRPSSNVQVQVEYGTQPALGEAAVTLPVSASSTTDYTVVTELRGLVPDTEYFYRGVVSDSGKDPVRGAVGRFRTAPETLKEFRFAWSADMEAGHQPFKLLDSVVGQRPDFFLHLGDMIYADVPKNRFVGSLSHYRYKHRENREDKFLQRLLAATPVAAIWDDHEVENDFNSTHPALAEGRQAFREYWPVRTVDAARLYRRFAWTPGVEVFILDCRSYRSPQSAPDDLAKTMLGKEQKAWLKENLVASKATFKFLVSSVPFLVSGGSDVWANYRTERQEIRLFLSAESIQNVIILSGDFHMALDLQGGNDLHEFLAGPIAAWPHCQMPGNAGSRSRLEGTGRFFMCDEFNYGMVIVRPDGRPPEVEIQFIDLSGKVRHRRVITASQRQGAGWSLSPGVVSRAGPPKLGLTRR